MNLRVKSSTDYWVCPHHDPSGNLSLLKHMSSNYAPDGFKYKREINTRFIYRFNHGCFTMFTGCRLLYKYEYYYESRTDMILKNEQIWLSVCYIQIILLNEYQLLKPISNEASILYSFFFLFKVYKLRRHENINLLGQLGM